MKTIKMISPDGKKTVEVNEDRVELRTNKGWKVKESSSKAKSSGKDK